MHRREAGQRPAAVVVLQIVDTPRGERLGVLRLRALPAGLARAGGGVGRLVDPELQTLAVNVGGQRGDAARELGGVPLKIPARVAPVHPAVVDVDVLVSDRCHAARNKGVSDALDQGLAGAASEGVPRVPAHGWRRGDGRRARAASGATSGARRPASAFAACRRRTSRRMPGLAARASGARRCRSSHRCQSSHRCVPRPPSRLDRPSPADRPSPRRLSRCSRRLLRPRCPNYHPCQLRHRSRSLRYPNRPGPSKSWPPVAVVPPEPGPRPTRFGRTVLTRIPRRKQPGEPRRRRSILVTWSTNCRDRAEIVKNSSDSRRTCREPAGAPPGRAGGRIRPQRPAGISPKPLISWSFGARFLRSRLRNFRESTYVSSRPSGVHAVHRSVSYCRR